MNRTISCTVNEDVLKSAFVFLGRNNFSVETLGGLVRVCVELVAEQLSDKASSEELQAYKEIAVTGRVSRRRQSAVRLELQSPALDKLLNTQELEKPWWQQLGCVSEDEALRYTQFLSDNGITRFECSYTQWQMHISGVKPLEGMSSELTQQAVERAEAFKREREVMDELIRQHSENMAGDEND